MPFTVNVGPYIGGQLMAQGIGNLGQGIGEGIASIGKAMAESKKIEDEQGADQIILNYGKKLGLVSPEEENIYIKGSHSAKTAFVGGLLRKFTMNQQVQQQAGLDEDRKARREQDAQELFLKKAEANWTPSPEDIAAAKEQGVTYLPTGPGKYGIKSAPTGDEADTIDYQEPGGPIHKVPIRSAFGQKLLEKKNPAMALEWNTGLTAPELFNSDLHEAGTVDGNGNFIPIKPDIHGKYDPKAGTHIRIGGATVMPRQQFNYYQNRLKASGQAPKAGDDTATAPAAPAATATTPGGDRVQVTKGGKTFTVPTSQLDDAMKQGYKKI